MVNTIPPSEQEREAWIDSQVNHWLMQEKEHRHKSPDERRAVAERRWLQLQHDAGTQGKAVQPPKPVQATVARPAPAPVASAPAAQPGTAFPATPRATHRWDGTSVGQPSTDRWADTGQVIEPTKYADVMAQIGRVGKNDHAGAGTALDMLSRCADSDPLKDTAAINALKIASGFPVGAIRKMFFEMEKRNRPLTEQDDRPKWKDDLVYREDGITPYGHLANACVVLRGHDDFLFADQSSIFALDDFSGFPMLQNEDRPVTEDDVASVTEQVQRLGVPTSEGVVLSAIRRVATAKRYHPPREFLEACKAAWDRQPRLDQLLTYYAGVDAGPEPMADAQRRLPMATGARWCIGAVARIYHPGAKMDTALILEGVQGLGKSTFFKILAGEEFFTDQISEFGSKDSSQELAGVWIIELSELDAMSKSEVSRIKRFLTQTHDRFRPPYARMVIKWPRGCCFCGTTNENEYLRDPTGGRRFWTHKSHLIRLRELERDRAQLWGEAVHRYEAGEKWWLHEPELEADAAWEVQKRYVADPWEEPIGELLRSIAVQSRGYVLFREIWEHLSIPKIDQDAIRQRRISNVLARLGWHQEGQIREGDERPRTYKPKPPDREPGW